MKTNYQMARDWLDVAAGADSLEERMAAIATAQVYATLAVAEHA